MQAIVEIQGKQYFVKPDQTIRVDKALEEIDEKTKALTFDRVLLAIDGEEVQVGKPYIEGGKVEAKPVRNFKGKKIRVLKYKNKINYHVVRGHRQHYTELKITKISA